MPAKKTDKTAQELRGSGGGRARKITAPRTLTAEHPTCRALRLACEKAIRRWKSDPTPMTLAEVKTLSGAYRQMSKDLEGGARAADADDKAARLASLMTG